MGSVGYLSNARGDCGFHTAVWVLLDDNQLSCRDNIKQCDAHNLTLVTTVYSLCSSLKFALWVILS